MKSPRLLRSPFLWILAAFLLIILGMNLFSASSRYQQVPTSKVIESSRQRPLAIRLSVSRRVGSNKEMPFT